MEPILTVSGLTKTYGGNDTRTNALRGLDLKIFPGEFVGVMGPSGSGKTTFLNCISTIDSPTGGTITVDGTDLTKLRGKALSKFRRERLGFIFQDCNLLDTLTALENIALEIEQNLQSQIEREVSSLAIGEQVMERLKRVDQVAYVRFASVYRQFKDLNTFMEELNKLLEDQ